MPPGDFTSRFDREIIRSQMAEAAAKESAADKERREAERVESQLAEIGKILDRRAAFLRERFPNASPEECAGVGFKLRFLPKAGRPAGATFWLRARVNESRLAILVESNFEIPDAGAKEYDYVTLPVQRPEIERARSFIEAKLLDFARVYVG